MAEQMLELRGLPKSEAYAALDQHVAAVLDGISDPIAAMATIASLVHHGFGHLWTGFYRVVPPGRLLRIGPYQGTLGCLEMEFGRGVCGAAAAAGRTVIVPNCAEFPGHIVCDSRARSEIVVPTFDGPGSLIGVFDIDSSELNTFDEADRVGLERLVQWFARKSV